MISLSDFINNNSINIGCLRIGQPPYCPHGITILRVYSHPRGRSVSNLPRLVDSLAGLLRRYLSLYLLA